MDKSLLKFLLENGVSDHLLPSQKRAVIFSNFISLIFSLASMLLFLIVPENRNAGGLTESLVSILIFCLPILLNRLGFTQVSRLYLCWVPPFLVTWAMVMGMREVAQVPASSYGGLRVYLLATSCVPYLLTEKKITWLFVLGLLPNLLLILFFDFFMDLFGVGYFTKGAADAGYSFIQARSLIAYVIIGGTCLSLRYIVDQGDQRNQRLVEELNEKNRMIMREAAEEVSELDKQLEIEQKHAKLSDAIFKSAFDHSAIGMALTSIDGKLIKVNDHLCKITEFTVEELLGSTVKMFSYPDDVAADEALIQKCLRGEIETYEREKRHIKKSGKIGWIKVAASLVREPDGSPLYFVRQIEDISERKQAEEEKDRARYLLNERVKELTTLYETGRILQDETRMVDDLMQEVVNVLPPGWQYPDITEARILIGGIEFKTPHFSKVERRQQAHFYLPQGMLGMVEIVYLEERPQEVEGPFLLEERNLINMIAEMLRIYFAKRHESMALRSSEANLSAIINNTDVLIWSVDRNLNLTAFNKPLFNHVRANYGIVAQLGAPVIPEGKTEQYVSFANRWRPLYQRALDGERLSFEETRFNRVLQFSMGPIVETNGRITGVNVYATDITEHRQKEIDLNDANKKIGELRLMALRSVMNPHFVFNVLSSIQFFIANNDRLNAINYLSTFSKLIRSVLNHSVNNLVKISDEIDMLKNYIQLEQVRFDNKFDFNLEVDENLEVNDIEVPSLLIQPYVENAILHGLNNKDGKGKLSIRISEQDDAVLFEIEDDGIGREAAMKLRQQNFPTHKSMGIKLTEERLKLINEHRNVSFEVIDLRDENGPCGTRVKIWVRT